MGIDGDIITHNPLLKRPLLAVIEECLDGEERNKQELERACDRIWDETYRLTPGAAVDALVRDGSLSMRVTLDGQPFDGTLEDIQVDESIPQDAVADVLVVLSEHGRELFMRHTPEATMESLFADRPAYKDVFVALMKACADENGATRSTLEHIVEAVPFASPGESKVYPQYFIDSLESAGAIEWKDVWRATASARAYLKRL